MCVVYRNAPVYLFLHTNGKLQGGQQYQALLSLSCCSSKKMSPKPIITGSVAAKLYLIASLSKNNVFEHI